MKKFPLNPWGPWQDNPSKKENFYPIEELSEKEESPETEDLNEEVIEEVIGEKIESEKEKLKTSDPYADILKDL